MPYIEQKDRERAEHAPVVPGELNFAITTCAVEFLAAAMDETEFVTVVKRLCLSYFEEVGLSYTNANAVMGVLFCVGKELMRRVNPDLVLLDTIVERLGDIQDEIYDNQLAPYEDTKIAENGDVYPEEILS